MTRAFVLLAILIPLSLTNSFAQTKKRTSVKTADLDRQITAGKAVYIKNCMVCHQADGLGVQSMNPPLSRTIYTLGPKEQIIRIVLGGFNEQIEINGDVYINAMPSFSALTDTQVADVITYVRNSFGNKASAVSVADVKVIRSKLFK